MKTILKALSFCVGVALVFALVSSLGADQIASLAIGVGVNAITMSITLPAGSLGAFVGVGGEVGGETQVQVISMERERAIHLHNYNKSDFATREIAPSYLRMEADLSNSDGTVVFKTFVGDGATVYPTEVRLERNDSFIATDAGIFLLNQDVANKKTNARLCSYPNITVFGAAAADDLWAIYAGQLNIVIDQKKKLVKWDGYRCISVPETQQTSAGNNDKKSGLTDGFAPLTPQIVLNGAGTNEIEYKFPTYPAFAGATPVGATVHKLVLYLRGLLVTGQRGG